jgi:trehalose 6-phosphate phosphatase
MCWEINPLISWNKGKAFSWIQNYLFEDDKCIFRLYIGDDRTDEDVFSILGDDDFSILVLSEERKSSTQANYKVNSQEEVAELLKKLNQQLQ